MLRGARCRACLVALISLASASTLLQNIFSEADLVSRARRARPLSLACRRRRETATLGQDHDGQLSTTEFEVAISMLGANSGSSKAIGPQILSGEFHGVP